MIRGECPFSQISQVRDFLENRELVCDLCKEVVDEDAVQEHIDSKHLTMTCPACKSRHEVTSSPISKLLKYKKLSLCIPMLLLSHCLLNYNLITTYFITGPDRR